MNAAVLWVAVRFIPGFALTPREFVPPGVIAIPPLAQSFLLGGVVLALLNVFVRPILKLLSFPLILLTLGLFHVVINLAVLALADSIVTQLEIHGFTALLIGSLLLGLANAPF